MANPNPTQGLTLTLVSLTLGAPPKAPLAPLPYQESLLLENQYRPDLPRPVYRLLADTGLVSIRRGGGVGKEPAPAAPPRQQHTLPFRVLLGRIRAGVPRPRSQGARPGPWSTAEVEEGGDGEGLMIHEVMKKMVNHNMQPRVYFLPS